jgi:UDP:flavonoid glycosyltransferase YjiC (YdhE family)
VTCFRGSWPGRELPANVVVTVGEHIDPAEFEPQPTHIRIERFIPQSTLLPNCDLVVSHGGSGSVVGALAHGLPAILIQMGADSPTTRAGAPNSGQRGYWTRAP